MLTTVRDKSIRLFGILILGGICILQAKFYRKFKLKSINVITEACLCLYNVFREKHAIKLWAL